MRGSIIRKFYAVVVSLALVVAGSGSSGAASSGALLPNLVAQSPWRVLEGCNPYEVVFEEAEKCIRFDTVVVNLGRGPLELRYQALSDGGQQRTIQRIFTSGGEHLDRSAGNYELHPTHAHFHYGRMFTAKLWAIDSSGHPVGKDPVRETHKAGFCFYDAQNYWDGQKRSVPAAYPADNCRSPQPQQDNSMMVTGLSRGWMDFYDYSLDGQYIEVSNLVPDNYLLEIIIDPDNLIRESAEDDNRIAVPVRVG